MAKRTNERGVRLYSLYGILIKILWEEKGLENELAQFLTPFPFFHRTSVDKSVHIEIILTTTDVSPNHPLSASRPLTCYDLSIAETDGYVYLTDGFSSAQLQLRSGKGLMKLHRSFRYKNSISKQNFFLISLILLLSRWGFYDLHAAGVVKDGAGYLVLGESGSGKSSATLSLVSQGWHYLSDDALLLRRTSDGIEALAFRKKFYLDQSLAYHFPEIAPYLEKRTDDRSTKQFLELEKVYPGQFRPRCYLKILVFSKIVPQPKSTLVTLDKTSVMIKLIKQSASLSIKKHDTERHLNFLKELVSQTRCYQLSAGLDLYKNPKNISLILPSK
jgi:hypothetical protein